LQKLTTSEVICAEEVDDNPWPVATASLANRAGDEEPAMSLDQEGWMSLKWWEMEDLDFSGERAAPIYGGKIWSAVTEFIPPSFRRSASASAISRGSSAGTQHCRCLRRRGCGSLKMTDPGVPPGPDPRIF
jgi:hypothetical protein